MKEYILCAAIYYDNGKKRGYSYNGKDTGLMICGLRHNDCFVVLFEITDANKLNKKNATQGFLTSRARFVDRKDAAAIAFKAKQIKGKINLLFSEDLY